MKNISMAIETSAVETGFIHICIYRKGMLLENTYKFLHLGTIKLSLLSRILDFLFQFLDLQEDLKDVMITYQDSLNE